jgi:hypothetical protein
VIVGVLGKVALLDGKLQPLGQLASGGRRQVQQFFFELFFAFNRQIVWLCAHASNLQPAPL